MTGGATTALVRRHDFQPGDQIYVYRKLRSFQHHGIYVGNDRVIHYGGTPMNEAVVREVSLAEFENGKVARKYVDDHLKFGRWLLTDGPIPFVR